MDRETWIPLVGLLGLVLAGAVMLYATTGKEPDPVGPKAAADKTRASKSKTGKAPNLIFKRDPSARDLAPEGAPNFVVVVACSVRKDALGVHGGPEGLTPRLVELAVQGTRFDDALAAAVFSRESIGAMLTGRHAVELGLVEPSAKPSKRTLDAEVLTLPELLAERGWWTVGVNTSPEISRPKSALWQGFDYVRDAHPEGFKQQYRLTDVHAVQQAIRMMNERPLERPFYLQIVLADSHKPLKIPKAESAPYEQQGLPTPAYMASVRRLDDAVGFLVDWLDETGLGTNTYLVVIGDHGEGLSRPEHHGPGHGRFLAHSTVSVPWIVRGPGIPAGGHVEGLASGVDLAPTIVGLAGVDGLPEGDGLDLSDLLQAGRGRTPRNRAITDTWYTNANRAAIWTSTRQCQRDFGSTNLEGDPFVDGCFDRVGDPDFHTPIADEALTSELVAWRERRAAERPDAAAP